MDPAPLESLRLFSVLYSVVVAVSWCLIAKAPSFLVDTIVVEKLHAVITPTVVADWDIISMAVVGCRIGKEIVL